MSPVKCSVTRCNPVGWRRYAGIEPGEKSQDKQAIILQWRDDRTVKWNFDGGIFLYTVKERAMKYIVLFKLTVFLDMEYSMLSLLLNKVRVCFNQPIFMMVRLNVQDTNPLHFLCCWSAPQFYSADPLHCSMLLIRSTVLCRWSAPQFYADDPLHSSMPLIRSTVLCSWSTPLFYAADLLHCSMPLICSTVLCHWSAPQLYTADPLHCSMPLIRSTVLCRWSAPLFYASDPPLCFRPVIRLFALGHWFAPLL